MINTRIKYIVYNHSGTGVRHHHFGVQNNIINEADGMAASGDTINALGIPVLPFNGNNLPFAFMSVHGAADGNHLYTSPGNQTVPVGSTDIDILVVYGPVGGIGGPGGGPGIWVDAFNVDTGQFSDSPTFMQVLTPPTPPDTLDNAKTNEANAEGDVSSLTAESIRANPTCDGAPFLEWKKIIPVETIVNARDFSISQNETGEIWFAFYQTVPPNQHFKDIHDKMYTMISKWVSDDYCGTPPHVGPGGPIGPFGINVGQDIMKNLNPAQKTKLEGYMKEYPSLASAGYNAMTKVADVLKGVGDILSGIKGR